MPEQKQNFVLIKTASTAVFFTVRLVTNPVLTREIYLTKKRPQQPLPLDWCLSIIADPSLYAMYKNGLFTFDDNEALAEIAYEKGYWFDKKFDFTPATKEDSNLIFSILKVGNRVKIEETIKKYGADKVKDVAIAHLSELTQNVIQLLEKVFKVQLVMDNVADIE